ncbi:MAG TPA: glycosyltransferase [Rhodopila sp.]|uniref:glycosyltransferase family 2 protein n=1 Tax=Rhodopila sp. TaxID=2480087 RepID=UPI002C9383D1|nr:glycosyltransferase [Rhodopila sp.]HVY14586.1 glycosyltransferase [Rhodopila sp.]
MDLTVCICTTDRPRYVRDCLRGLARQTVPRQRFALLIVDSASADRTELAALADEHDARLVRVERPGVSLARNAGAWAARSRYIAYIDDDAIPEPNWIESILASLRKPGPPPALIGGRILPKWEAPLPRWWPSSLRGVLSIIEHEGEGEYRTDAVPPKLEPYGANMVVNVLSLLAAGGFGSSVGRYGDTLLSDEEVQLAWSLQDAGYSVRYDSRIVVYHQIQARRLCPEWLLSRLYWQGASTVLTRRLLQDPASVWRELPRRLAVACLLAPAMLVPRRSTRLLAARWRLAYATGFIRAALGWQAAAAAETQARLPATA